MELQTSTKLFADPLFEVLSKPHQTSDKNQLQGRSLLLLLLLLPFQTFFEPPDDNLPFPLISSRSDFEHDPGPCLNSLLMISSEDLFYFYLKKMSDTKPGLSKQSLTLAHLKLKDIRTSEYY